MTSNSDKHNLEKGGHNPFLDMVACLILFALVGVPMLWLLTKFI